MKRLSHALHPMTLPSWLSLPRRMRFLRYCATTTALLLSTTLSHAMDLSLTLEIPKLKVNPYHRPYVAVWIETPERKGVETVAIWYGDNEEEWLKDVRQWWRKLGRRGGFDAQTGATKRPGQYKIVWQNTELAAGEYVLCVEAAREAGGREWLKQRFVIGSEASKKQHFTLNGHHELGTVNITIED